MKKTLIGPMPASLKSLILIVGVILALVGLPVAAGSACVGFLMVTARAVETISPALFLLTLTLLTFVAGIIIAVHASRSAAGKPSTAFRLPAAWQMVALSALALLFALAISTVRYGAGILFAPALVVAALIPPLLALSWFRKDQADGLTWRRGLLALIGGATIGVGFSIVLEFFLPLMLVALFSSHWSYLGDSLESLATALAGNEVARALTSPGFVLLFVDLAVIAPLVEEFCKPLATLPIIGRLSRRDAFLVAAMAGAGFAALENIFYVATGISFWAGVLLVRATGAAIHPLGAGLVGLSWRDLLNGERNALRNGLGRFGLAVGIHALWNGGTLLVITLAGAQFFGRLPAGVNILGISIAGIVLALLIVLGLGALWLGRTVLSRIETPAGRTAATIPPDFQFLLSNRAVALWAVACLIVVVPASVAALQWLLR